MAAAARSRALQEEGEIDEFWCVFDVEWPRNHPGLGEAIKQARENQIRLAVSNPCFELWLILHFQDHGGWLENNDARRLRRRHRANGIDLPHNNPSSGMHLLLATIEPPTEL